MVNEVTYAFSNIVGGSSHHIATFLDHPFAWDLVVSKFMICQTTMPGVASVQLQKEALEVVFNMITGLSDAELNHIFMLDRKTSRDVYDEIGQLTVAGVPNPSLDPRVASMFKSLVTILGTL